MDIPSCFDRCDGLDGRPGTPAAADQISVAGAGGATSLSTIVINERSDSPTIERAEQATITKELTMSWDEAVTRILFMGRGTTQTDSFGLKTKILSAEIRRQHGGYATMRIVSEGKNFDNPPDELEITPVALDIDIIKHPRYAVNLLPNNSDTTTQKQAKQTIIRAIQTYRDAPVTPDESTLTGLISTGGGQNQTIAGLSLKQIAVCIPNANYRSDKPPTPAPGTWEGYTVASPPPAWAADGDPNPPYFYQSYTATGDSVIDLALAAAQEIIGKIWRQQDTPYIVGFKVVWNSYYFKQQPLNPGGIIENPMTEANPALPDYLWSVDDPPTATSKSIFDWIAIYNPQCYSTDGTIPTAAGSNYTISWLRQSDERDYQRTWFKHSRTWIGAPYGYWDPEMYTRQARPSTIADYLLLS